MMCGSKLGQRIVTATRAVANAIMESVEAAGRRLARTLRRQIQIHAPAVARSANPVIQTCAFASQARTLPANVTAGSANGRAQQAAQATTPIAVALAAR